MENEYNSLEEKLNEEELSEHEKIKILERQKEMLLQFLIDSNKNLFNLLKSEREELIFPETLSFFESE